MKYEFINNKIDFDNLTLPESDKINPFLLKNNQQEFHKAIEFWKNSEKFLYVHGFMGTGKRQFINYICEFINNDVIKLEYYCKESTVSDDIFLCFNNIIDDLAISKATNFTAKITSLNLKLQQKISSIKKPFVIILHALDDVQEQNLELLTNNFSQILQEENVKIIISTRAMKQNILKDYEEDRKIFLKALSKPIFKEFLEFNKISFTETILEDFYKYTRGYYYYLALSVKIIQAMGISLSEFLLKFNQSDTNFDSFLGITYINLVPTTIRNFFWFLRTIRHGLTLNALAVFELYDEYSVEYLKNNLMIFQVDETLYVQDYFLQKIDISIPEKTEIKLHKYIINIYEEQLKEPLKTRLIMISRQAFRAEIEYHKQCIAEIENKDNTAPIEEKSEENKESLIKAEQENTPPQINRSIVEQLEQATELINDKKVTNALELLQSLAERENLDLYSLIEIRLKLAKAYCIIEDYSKAAYYYELVETYCIQHNEQINLLYLYYDMADLYFKMYKNERAIETIKKVIYSVDTPQSLMVSACTLIANIYSEIKSPKEAYSYYQKALESIREDVKKETLAELYFKFALANDDNGDYNTAFEYYNKCLFIEQENPYRALSYSNMASCYYENNNLEDAINCFKNAYELEKINNNYDGIYYNASNLAKIYILLHNAEALKYLIEAQKSAEFINEPLYSTEAAIALGDYYYNIPNKKEACLEEYFKAKVLSRPLVGELDVKKIDSRIFDMKQRMSPESFTRIEKKYEDKI